VAVTVTRSRCPTSAVTSAWALLVAPEMLVHSAPAELQRWVL
jgi:hypothetical protein